jgi:hypothetical protein
MHLNNLLWPVAKTKRRYGVGTGVDWQHLGNNAVVFSVSLTMPMVTSSCTDGSSILGKKKGAADQFEN